MSGTGTVILHELRGRTARPGNWLLLAAFSLSTAVGVFFHGHFFAQGRADLTILFGEMPWLLAPLSAALAMDLWAEERSQGMLELLRSLPMRPWALLLGKYAAAWLWLLLALISTMPLWLTVNYLGQPDNRAILVGYLGSALLGGALLAVATVAAQLARDEVAAFVGAALASVGYLVVGDASMLGSQFALPPFVLRASAALDMLTHFSPMAQGVLGAADLAYFVLTILAWLGGAGLILQGWEPRQ